MMDEYVRLADEIRHSMCGQVEIYTCRVNHKVIFSK